MAFLIEVENRAGALLARHRFEAGPVTVGRGYDNDVIVSDPYLEARHLEFREEAGELHVRPLATGAHLRGGAVLEAEQALPSGSVLLAGLTRLRVLDTEHPVPPALTLHALDEVFAWLARPAVFAVGMLVGAVLVLIDAYGATYEEFKLGEFASSLLPPVAIWGLYAGVWGLLGRVMRHEFRFLHHCWAVLIFLLLLWGRDWVVAIVGYNSGSLSASFWLATALFALALLVMLSLNLRFAFDLRKGRRWFLAVLGTLAVAGGDVLDTVTRQAEFRSSPEYAYELLPEALRFGPSVSKERYLSDAASVFEFSPEALGQAEDAQPRERTKGSAAATDEESVPHRPGPEEYTP